jgi:hypothetical protein
MAIYRHYARKQERINLVRILGELSLQKKGNKGREREGKAYTGRSNQPGPRINLQENPNWGFPPRRSLSDLYYTPCRASTGKATGTGEN